MRPQVSSLLLATVCLVGCVTAHAGGPPPAAILTGVAGRVTVANAAGTKVVRPGSSYPLRVGDKVSTATGARGKVVYPDRKPVQLQARATLTITAAAPTAPRSPARADVWAATVRRVGTSFVGERAAPAAVARGIGDETAPHPVAPLNTAVLEPSPQFSWTQAEGIATYRLTIAPCDGEGGAVHIMAGGTGLAYPETAPALRSECRYSWIIQGDEDPDCVSESAWFVILSEARREQYLAALQAAEELYAEDPGEKAATLGYLAAEYGLLSTATERFTDALRLAPDDETLLRALAAAHAARGLEKEARAITDRLPVVSEEERALWRQVLPQEDKATPKAVGTAGEGE